MIPAHHFHQESPSLTQILVLPFFCTARQYRQRRHGLYGGEHSRRTCHILK